MALFRILITGSRDYNDVQHATSVLRWALLSASVQLRRDIFPSDVVIVHGGARGADRVIGEAAAQLGFQTEVHPAQWDNPEHGRSAGYIRNALMVSLGADIVLAFPVGKSSGTRHCMRTAEKVGLRVINVTEGP